MNQSPSQHTGVTGTFSSQAAPQTNPFSADLREEFTSNFGTNTNAVSQIFKEGGFVSQSKTKYIIAAAVGAVVIGIVAYLALSSGSSEDEGKVDDQVAEEGTAEDSGAAASEENADNSANSAENTATTEQAADPAAAGAPASAGSGAVGAPALTSPNDGASQTYNELEGPLSFTWSGGPGGAIVFSRSSTMQPEIRRVNLKGNSYSFYHPYPGKWYWKVENSAGASEVRSFRIEAPARRNVAIMAPTASAQIAGNGGPVSWQGDSYVAFYRVELSNNGGWASPQYRFATSGTTVNLQNVAAGQYQLRVGAFSEVAGRWEYTQPIPVTVQ